MGIIEIRSLGDPSPHGYRANSLQACRPTLAGLVRASATPAYWDRAGRPQVPGDLEGHNCLNYAYLSTGNTWRMMGPDGKDYMVPAAGNIVSNNVEALLEAALEGVGVVNLPTWMVGQDLYDGRLEEVLQAYSLPEPAVHAIYPPGRHLSAKVRAFVDYLVDYFKQRPMDVAA